MTHPPWGESRIEQRPGVMPLFRDRLAPHGLRPTLRHLMILVVHVALVSSLLAPMLRADGPGVLLATVFLPLSPPLLAVLVLLLDRPGPAKYWLVGLLGSLTFPAFVAWCDGMAAVAWAHGWGWAALWVALAVLNLFGIRSLTKLAGRRPRRCPDCGRRSLLPIARTRWCASCGLKMTG